MRSSKATNPIQTSHRKLRNTWYGVPWKRSAPQVWSQAREQARTDHREQVDQEASPGKRLELTAEVPRGANVRLDVLRRVCLVQVAEYPTVPWRASAGVRQGEFSGWMTIRHGHATTADVDSGRAAGKDAKRNQRAGERC